MQQGTGRHFGRFSRDKGQDRSGQLQVAARLFVVAALLMRGVFSVEHGDLPVDELDTGRREHDVTRGTVGRELDVQDLPDPVGAGRNYLEPLYVDRIDDAQGNELSDPHDIAPYIVQEL